MKTIITLCMLFWIMSISFGQSTYSKVRIYTNAAGLRQLWNEGLPVDHGIYKDGEHFTTDLSDLEIAVLDSLQFTYEVIVPDVISHYQNVIQIEDESQPRNVGCPTQPSGQGDVTPANFYLPTSYGGFYKYAEMLAELDKMAQLYPHLISAKSGVSNFVTAENRPIYHVRISNSPNMDNGNPRVLYTAIHHAREPLSMSQLIFYMWYLLENYGSDPEVTYLLDNTQMFFVPCLNPDGYIYNETQTPNGGGMHRKNRNPAIGTTNKGVDLNRNYSYQWGTTGISTNQNNDTYPGTSAFSEPETKAMRWLVQNYRITSGFNAHTHGNDLLFPIGSTSNEFADHHDYLDALAGHFCRENGFGYFKSSGLYPASGDSDDYMYKVDNGVQQKDTMFVMTPEIGSAFWPARSEIIPTSKNMLQPNLGIAHMVRRYYIGQSADPLELVDEIGNFTINLKKLGREAGSATISLIPLQNLATIGAPQTVTYITMQSGQLQFSYQLLNTIQAGDSFRYVLEINDGLYVQRDTVTHRFGGMEVLVNEGGTSTSNWTGSWGTTTSSYYSAPRSFTDSPSGNYQNNANSPFMYNSTIDLTEVADARVTFWAKWAIESGYDYAQFQVSTDDGATWIGQCGRYTVLGVSNQGGVQPVGQPLWSGTNSSWVEEEISLSDYIGQVIKVRFLMRADGGSRADGFYFDDFKISVRYPIDPTDPEDSTDPEEGVGVDLIDLQYVKVSPNPFSHSVFVEGWNTEMSIRVVEITGRPVSFIQNENQLNLNEVASGTYLIQITYKGKSKTIKIIK